MRRLKSRLCPFCGPGGAASPSNLSFRFAPRRGGGLLFARAKSSKDSATATSSGRAELIVHDRSMRSLHNLRSLKELRSLRILLHYGGYQLRYDLQISGLSFVPWADAGLYFCAQSYRGTSLPLRGNDCPGSLRLPGCLAALGTGVWCRGCKLAECTVRTCAPCRQYPFERPAGGLLHVPERQKKNRQFGGFA